MCPVRGRRLQSGNGIRTRDPHLGKADGFGPLGRRQSPDLLFRLPSFHLVHRNPPDTPDDDRQGHSSSARTGRGPTRTEEMPGRTRASAIAIGVHRWDGHPRLGVSTTPVGVANSANLSVKCEAGSRSESLFCLWPLAPGWVASCSRSRSVGRCRGRARSRRIGYGPTKQLTTCQGPLARQSYVRPRQGPPGPRERQTRPESGQPLARPAIVPASPEAAHFGSP
jgi:hypothetical protein